MLDMTESLLMFYDSINFNVMAVKQQQDHKNMKEEIC